MAARAIMKKNFWHIEATNMKKYTFLDNSTTSYPFLKLVRY